MEQEYTKAENELHLKAPGVPLFGSLSKHSQGEQNASLSMQKSTHDKQPDQLPISSDIDSIDTLKQPALNVQVSTSELAVTLKLKQSIFASVPLEDLPTHKLLTQHSANQNNEDMTTNKPLFGGRLAPTSGFCLAILLLILVINGTTASFPQFVGSQGWSFALNGAPQDNQNLLVDTQKQFIKDHATPGAIGKHATPGTTPTAITPEQYINFLVQHMSLKQKLGQMMFVQFAGQDYAFDLPQMITQDDIGSVLFFQSNIASQTQLKGIIQQMQQNASGGIPLIISTDEEGGFVDRLKDLDGPRPGAYQITTVGQAKSAGSQVAQDLASYGINLNLAPVVDVTNVESDESYNGRTFGSDAATVTRLAGAYLQGLQQSGKVLGILKHFPGLGDVTGDPHQNVTWLTRPKSQIEAIDWAPYRSLLAQGNVHAILVTHEIVSAIDNNLPASLSPKVITGILRNELGFQGVVITDSLSMQGLLDRYTETQATILAVQAGADLIMGGSDAQTVSAMQQALTQAISSGQISQQRINQSVSRVLMLKYDMGLIKLPHNS